MMTPIGRPQLHELWSADEADTRSVVASPRVRASMARLNAGLGTIVAKAYGKFC